MGKVESNKMQKRSRLLDSALSLFTTKGPSSTSISEIAHRAGVGKGTFYLYFKDKSEIETRLVSRRASQLLGKAMAEAPSVAADGSRLPLEDRLIGIIDLVVDALEADPSLVKFLSKNLSWGIFRNAVDDPYTQEERDCQKQVRDMLAEYGDGWEQPALMIYTVVELTSSTCYNILRNGDPVTMDIYRPYLHRDIAAIVRNHAKVKKEAPAAV